MNLPTYLVSDPNGMPNGVGKSCAIIAASVFMPKADLLKVDAARAGFDRGISWANLNEVLTRLGWTYRYADGQPNIKRFLAYNPGFTGIIEMRGHVTAVVNGDLMDAWKHTGRRKVKGFWTTTNQDSLTQARNMRRLARPIEGKPPVKRRRRQLSPNWA